MHISKSFIILVSSFLLFSAMSARMVYIDGVDCPEKRAFVQLLKLGWKRHRILSDEVVLDREAFKGALATLREDGRDAIVITNFETAEEFRTFLDVTSGYDSLFVLTYMPLPSILSSFEEFEDETGLKERFVLDKLEAFLTRFISITTSYRYYSHFKLAHKDYLSLGALHFSSPFCVAEEVVGVFQIFLEHVFPSSKFKACDLYALRHYDIVIDLSECTAFEAVAYLREAHKQVTYPEAPVENVKDQSWRRGYFGQPRE